MGTGINTSPTTDQTVAALVQTLRGYLRDHAHLNRLIGDEETSDRFLAWALVDALDDINNTPPPLYYGLENFPWPGLLIRGAMVTVLESVGLLQTRNQLSYSDGGIHVSVSDKTPLLQSWINLFQSKYEQKKVQWKISQNINGSFGGGGVHSEYWYISGFYGDF
jgi:hypothetical protein